MCYALIQVHALPVGLGKSSGQGMLTYYPSMPGNSTRRPEEKAALQRGAMSPEYFEGALQLSCNFITMDDLVTRSGIEHINLLKVSFRAEGPLCFRAGLSCALHGMPLLCPVMYCTHLCCAVCMLNCTTMPPVKTLLSLALQVDCEGDELDVLLGMHSWERVDQVVMEVHEVEGRVQAAQALLEQHGFLVTVHGSSAPHAAMLYAAKQDVLLNL